MDLNLEESLKAVEISPSGSAVLCDVCQKINLENLGCHFEGLPKVLFSSDGLGAFDKYAGYEYPYTVGDLDEARKRCELCALLWRTVYRDGDIETKVKRDKTSRIKLSYHQLNYYGVYKDYPPRACFRVHLEKPFQRSLQGNLAPLYLRVYTKPEDEPKVARFGFGRQVVPADSDVAFERILSSLNDCIQNHPACARTVAGEICEESTTLPARLIDLGTTPEDIPSLVETAGSNGKYVALSYCWGNVSEPILTKTSTIESFKKGLPLDSMPKTIKDAMAVTKRLGFRYLWADRLCILQDDKADWETEAQKMGRIYENAVFTIAAVGANDSGEGCFLPRPQEKALALPFENITLLLSYVDYYMDNGLEGTTQSAYEMWSSPWATRAWVFQERLFSRRMILYGKTQNFWECRMHLDTETRFGNDAGFTYKCSKYQYCRDFKQEINKQVYLALQRSASEVSNTDRKGVLWYLFDYVWSEILAQYSQMKLTNEEDRLPAMAGLAQAVQQLTNKEVSAGMWLGSFPQSLFWWPRWWSDYELDWKTKNFPWIAGTFTPRPVRSSKLNAPSWSWLAAGTPVSFYPFFRATELGIEKERFIQDDVTSGSLSQAGHKLEMWAHIIAASRKEDQVPPNINKHFTEEAHQIPINTWTGIHDRWEADGIYGLAYYEDERFTDGMVLFDDTGLVPLSFECALIGAGPGIMDDQHRTTIYFLMIQPTTNPGEYVRIGIGIRCLEEGVDYLQHLPPKQHIVLI